MVDDWHSNQFVCRFSLAWLYISTGIMISVNSTLTIDRAIAIISPFSRLKFQVMISSIFDKRLKVSRVCIRYFRGSAIEISSKEFMKYHIPVFLVVVHCAICIPIYLLYEIVCDHCIPVSHESKLMANYKLVLGCIQAFVWPSLSHFSNNLIYRRFSLHGSKFYTVGTPEPLLLWTQMMTRFQIVI